MDKGISFHLRRRSRWETRAKITPDKFVMSLIEMAPSGMYVDTSVRETKP